MAPTVRPARRGDDVVDLLYASAPGFYAAYAGGAERGRRLLARLYPRPAHLTGFDVCRLADLPGRREPAGVVAGFPGAEGARRARRYLALTVPRLGPRRWPGALAALRAAGSAPPPAAGAWYVDALAVAPTIRRRGVARALLDDAERCARAAGCNAVALDTTLENAPARGLYKAAGFEPGDARPAGPRAWEVLGTRGSVAYVKRL